ncbi:RNA polymerase sigma factor [Catellatospora vulcania]|uniref:RNA polymerase sigma factor n=1 Tax=Catellatospora vulcania TaxID=1460450 RepID=UPI001E60257E|nr:DUF6596 domain-containing protein [Catellatospora vulcania]
MTDRRVEELLRELAPQVLGALVRRYGMFDACEDAVQEALLVAATKWPADGVPDNPRGWLITVGAHRLLDEVRSESARRRREDAVTLATPQSALLGAPADAEPDRDDSLTLLFLCCHPALAAPSQVALTLRAVGGLSTEQIATAFLVPTATMAQRISRAKASVKAAGASFAMPDAADRDGRLRAVLQVLYLIFNEGYATTAGPDLVAPQLSDEAIRLTRWLRRLLPDDPEVAGLLALMLLTDARRPARTRSDGSLVALADQDRGRWDRARITEGVALISEALPRGAVGPYQLQAAIAAVHDEAPAMADTDWPQILALYGLLEQVAPSPAVTLNRAVAVGHVHGPQAGLDLLATLAADPRMANHHRLLATRAHLLEQSGDHTAAAASYRAAATLATNLPERRHLTTRAAENEGRRLLDAPRHRRRLPTQRPG